MQRLFLLLALVLRGWAANPFFNVADFGAPRDGTAPATDAFRKAIEAAGAAGGGTVVVPAGNYVSGPIALISNLTLHIDAGAVIRFPAARLPFTEGSSRASRH